MNEQRKRILVVTGDHEVPYSKGLTATALMITGLGAGDAYAVADKVEEVLLELRRTAIPEDDLRAPEVSAAASKVSAHPELREVLVKRQRAAAREARASGGAVVEGRDIGTVVLPEAELKVFLSASPEERARRRAFQTGREGELERILWAMRKRDKRDAEREASPLRPAPGAVILDTTGLSLEGVVSRVVELAREAKNTATKKTPTRGT